MSLLELKNVSKKYSDDFKIDNVSFCIEEKGVYGFFAKGQAGKTMLATLLCGASEIDGGEILYKNKPLHKSAKQTLKIKKKIGYVPDACIFPSDMTLGELLDFTGRVKGVGPDKRARQIKEALELTGLSDRSEMLIAALTTSEKKRAAYANALIGNPDVIIIDEPIAVIDSAQRDEIKKLIEMLGRMKTVIIFSRSCTDIDGLCSYVGVLSDGALLAFEPIDELLSRLNKTVNAILRVRSNGAELAELIGAIESIDQVISAKTSGAGGAIADVCLECSTREGVTSLVSEAVEALGAEVISLKFSTLALSDVIDALSVRESADETDEEKEEA